MVSDRPGEQRAAMPCPVCGSKITARHVCPECGSWITFRNPTGYFAKGLLAVVVSLVLPVVVFALGSSYGEQQRLQAESQQEAERRREALRGLADSTAELMTTAMDFHDALHELKQACRNHGKPRPDASCTEQFMAAIAKLDRQVNRLTWQLHSLPMSRTTRQLRVLLENRYWMECGEQCDIRQRMTHHLHCSNKSYDGADRSQQKTSCRGMWEQHPALKACAGRASDDEPCKAAHAKFHGEVVTPFNELKNTLLCSVVADVHELRAEAFSSANAVEAAAGGVYDELAERWRLNMKGSHCERRLSADHLAKAFGIRTR